MSTEWESSEVMSEFLKVAAESGLISTDLNHEDGIGNPTKDTPVKDHTRNEPTKEYGIKTEPADMIDKAHPEQAWMNKNSTPVPSMGNGSLVENVKEQQKKDIEIAVRMPHGTLIGVHANLISELVKLANSLDSNGKIKEAARIDEAIKKISACPFVDGRLRKEAAVWFLLPLLLLGGGGGIKMFGQYFTSKQENLRIDLDDLYEKLIEHGERSKSATKAAQLLSPFRSKLASMDLSSKEGSDKYAAIINELGAILGQIKQLIAASRQDIGERSGFFSKLWGGAKDLFGFEDYKILDEKFNDFMKSYNEARKYLDKAKDIEAKVLGDAGGFEKATSFKTILDTGFMGKKYDTLEELEIALNSALKNLYESGKIKKSFTADIISDGKPTSTPNQLREVLDIVEKKLSS